ncbi:hypothetical protein NLX83_23875 [Allokutzneria sp. A3M-2-11 16]|uniref:hypothetical protein n=1 Tax=Allokutzneria sp. A3M-2-11 16 TaxID=2962043 RepID=UPI0020B6859F|nr:hypothetical protein [Allokutzneria sp. A3M-2-11 16]MCP3802314.1 hypothetical protein [Allokutzneria sp. A3M-2-11 16]
MTSSIGDLQARLQAAVDDLPLDSLTEAREHLRGVVLPRLHHLARTSSNPQLREALAAVNRAGVELDSGRRHAHETHRVTRDYMHACLGAPTRDDDRSYRYIEHAVHAPPMRPISETAPAVSPRRQPAPWVTDDPKTWPGRVDESLVPQRFHFSAPERVIAHRVARLDPHRIAPLPRAGGRTADAAVDGYAVEFKTLQPHSGTQHGPHHIGRVIRRMQHDSRQSTDPLVYGQGNNIVIDVSPVGLSREKALQGLNDYLRDQPELTERLARVRIMGTDYDIDWNRTRG